MEALEPRERPRDRELAGRAQETRVEGGGELGDLIHPGLAALLGHEGSAPALEECGLEPVESRVHGLGLVAAQNDVEGDSAHALGVHLVELAVDVLDGVLCARNDDVLTAMSCQYVKAFLRVMSFQTHTWR